VGQEVEEFAEVAVRGLEVAQRHLRVDLVVVAPPDARLRQVPRFHEVGDDPLHGALRDAHARGDVDHADVGVFGDAQQHDEVVGDERPTRPARLHERGPYRRPPNRGRPRYLTGVSV
jgi:hypothetical protein